MPEIELSAGTIDYTDTGGDGPVVVLLHGVSMDASVWRHVIADLRGRYRCVAPTLPLGSHRRPMRPDADLSIHGVARLVAELLERLDLRDVTLVMNDWGGAQLLVAEGRDERVGRLALVACEAFDNFPPGLPGRLLVAAVRLPGGVYALARGLRLRPLRRAPGGWGWMSKRPVPDGVMDAWFEPLATQREIRRDFRKYCLSAPPKRDLMAWAGALARFERPALVVWATEDKVMPREHGQRLADLFPKGRLVEIGDSYTLVPEDQPAQLSARLREFIPSGPAGSS